MRRRSITSSDPDNALLREGEPVSAVQIDDAAQEETIDEVEAALAWHDGDPRKTIETLLDDIRHLKLQLILLEGTSSRGFTRGWRPKLEQ